MLKSGSINSTGQSSAFGESSTFEKTGSSEKAASSTERTQKWRADGVKSGKEETKRRRRRRKERLAKRFGGVPHEKLAMFYMCVFISVSSNRFENWTFFEVLGSE